MSDPLLPTPRYVTGSEGVLPPLPLEPVFEWLPGEPCDPWYQQLFPPRRASGFVRWKLMTTALNHTRRLWSLREARLEAHITRYGPDPDLWPARHVGVVLYVPEVSYGACLGCLWLCEERSHAELLGALRAHEQTAPPPS